MIGNGILHTLEKDTLLRHFLGIASRELSPVSTKVFSCQTKHSKYCGNAEDISVSWTTACSTPFHRASLNRI